MRTSYILEHKKYSKHLIFWNELSITQENENLHYECSNVKF